MNTAVVRTLPVLFAVFSTASCAGNDPKLAEGEATTTEAVARMPVALTGLRPEPVAGMAVANGTTTIWYQSGSWKTLHGSPADNVTSQDEIASGQYQVPRGYNYSDLVGFWHRDTAFGAEYFRDGAIATVSNGDVRAPRVRAKWPGNESAATLVGIASSDDTVYSWYSDGKRAAGTATDLATSPVGTFVAARGQSSETVDAVAIDSGSSGDGTFWALYQDGTVSHGRASDLGAYGVWEPQAPVASQCPTEGEGAIVAPAGCVVFTPAAAGAAPDGVNATSNNYALEPGGAARGLLVVHLNGSLGSPTKQVVSPETNIYSVLAKAGYHVIGLSYHSDLVLGQECQDSTCYAASREAIVRGKDMPGAALSIDEDEGILARLDAALAVLAEERPNGGWKNFRSAGASAEERVKWSSVIASGHSQGGGHAAYLGKLFGLRGVLQLSSTCDSVAHVPAQWTSTGPWATEPAAKFIGVAAADDPICPDHAAVWAAMGLALERQHDDARTCEDSGSHGATISCSRNLLALPEILAAGLALAD